MRLGDGHCPLSGCRAPELACNELLHLCERLFAEGVAQVERRLCPPLNEDADKQLLLSEYEAWRHGLMFYLTTKLGPVASSAIDDTWSWAFQGSHGSGSGMQSFAACGVLR